MIVSCGSVKKVIAFAFREYPFAKAAPADGPSCVFGVVVHAAIEPGSGEMMLQELSGLIEIQNTHQCIPGTILALLARHASPATT